MVSFFDRKPIYERNRYTWCKGFFNLKRETIYWNQDHVTYMWDMLLIAPRIPGACLQADLRCYRVHVYRMQEKDMAHPPNCPKRGNRVKQVFEGFSIFWWIHLFLQIWWFHWNLFLYRPVGTIRVIKKKHYEIWAHEVKTSEAFLFINASWVKLP